MKNLLLILAVALSSFTVGCSKKDKNKPGPAPQDYVYTTDYRVIQYVQQRYGSSTDIMQPVVSTTVGQQAYNIRRDIYNEAVAAVGTTGGIGPNGGQGGYCYSRTAGNLQTYCECIQQTYYMGGPDIRSQCVSYCTSNPSSPDCYSY